MSGGAPAYRPPSMRNQTHKTRFTLGHNNGDHAIPANEHGRQYDAAMAASNWQRHQPVQRQQGRGSGNPHPPINDADLNWNQRELVKRREKTQCLAANLRNNYGRNPNPTPMPPEKYYRINNNYCWTHDYDVGDTHTSATCNNRKPGHITTANGCNNQGGSLLNKEKSQWPSHP